MVSIQTKGYVCLVYLHILQSSFPTFSLLILPVLVFLVFPINVLVIPSFLCFYTANFAMNIRTL